MAPYPLPLPSSSIQYLYPTPLTPSSFSPYGTAILPPLPSDLTSPPPSTTQIPISHLQQQQSPILANQGSAVKFSNISKYTETYASAPSALSNSTQGESLGQPNSKAKPAMSMFSCFPRRELRIRETSSSKKKKNSDTPNPYRTFPIKILERHPFTTQTFIPLNTTTTTKSSTPTTYLVIVAPSVPASSSSSSSPVTNPPDLSRIQAFVATPGTAVTYGIGTWHAPMVVLGEERIDFVVVQWVSGVGEEDCQEVVFGEGLDGKGGVEVVTGEVSKGGWARL